MSVHSKGKDEGASVIGSGRRNAGRVNDQASLRSDRVSSMGKDDNGSSNGHQTAENIDP